MRVLIVAALTLVLLLAFGVGWAASTKRLELASETSKRYLCGDEKLQEHMRQLMVGALDSALHDHVQHTFEVWMKDEIQQPARAKRGVDQGTAAYVRSRDAVLKWKLPPCP